MAAENAVHCLRDPVWTKLEAFCLVQDRNVEIRPDDNLNALLAATFTMPLQRHPFWTSGFLFAREQNSLTM